MRVFNHALSALLGLALRLFRPFVKIIYAERGYETSKA